MVGEGPLSKERWAREKEKNKGSNGEKVWLRTG